MKLVTLALVALVSAIGGSAGSTSPQPSATAGSSLTLPERAAACAKFPDWVQKRMGKEFPSNPVLAGHVAQQQIIVMRVEVYEGIDGCYAEPIKGASIQLPDEQGLPGLEAAAVRDYKHLKHGATPVYVVMRIGQEPTHGPKSGSVFLTIIMQFKLGDGPTIIA